MARRKQSRPEPSEPDHSAVLSADALRCRLQVARRILLENVALDNSPAERRHWKRLHEASGDSAGRLAAYEARLGECGLREQYEDRVQALRAGAAKRRAREMDEA